MAVMAWSCRDRSWGARARRGSGGVCFSTRMASGGSSWWRRVPGSTLSWRAESGSQGQSTDWEAHGLGRLAGCWLLFTAAPALAFRISFWAYATIGFLG